MPPRTYRITTLGCRVNHAETRDIEAMLDARGLHRATTGGQADLEIVHSCTVTSAAAAKSRQAIRRAGRRSAPAASTTTAPHVIVTGCYAGSHPEEAAIAAGDPSRVIPHAVGDDSTMLDRLAEAVDHWLERPHAAPRRRVAGPSGIVPLPVVAPPRTGGRHLRAELRIQDGCDAHCTFCIIPTVRPRLRSKTIADAVDEARQLVDIGHREIVLSGIFLGAYGHETALRRRQRRRGVEPLADLLAAVADTPGLERLRISSLEPGDVTETLLDAMVAGAPVVVPHLHLPLQSGSDAVLRKMNRQYRVGDYLDMIGQVNAALSRPGLLAAEPLPPAITTDIICGFPGESDADFAATVDVARRVGFLHMHVFPYSAKAGTAAARWRSAFVPETVKRQRVRTLIDLEEAPDDGLSIRFRRRLLERPVRVIVEQPSRDDPAWVTGRCDHYALVHLPGPLPRGTVVDAHVVAVTADQTRGEPLPTRHALPVLTTPTSTASLAPQLV